MNYSNAAIIYFHYNNINFGIWSEINNRIKNLLLIKRILFEIVYDIFISFLQVSICVLY